MTAAALAEALTRTQLADAALEHLRVVVEQLDDLPPKTQRDVVLVLAHAVGDLRALGVIR